MADPGREERGERGRLVAGERLAREIRRLRREAGLSQPEVAARVGYTRQYVSLAERPRRGLPSAGLVAALDAALKARGALIELRERAGEERRARRARSAEREPGEAATTPRVQSPVAPPNSESAPPGANAYADADVAGILAMSHAFQFADRRVGGGVLYPQVVGYLRAEIAPRLLEPGRSGGAVFSAAASITEIAGWMAHDGGHDQRARHHFDSAFRLATSAGNPALAANVCASMSHLAGQLGQVGDAVRIADAGLRRARSAAGTVRLVARLHAMAARALALRGERRACLAALEEADRVLSRVGTEPDADWIAGFDTASLAGEAAGCLRHLGELGEAERQAHRVITLREGDRVRARAFGQLTLARILIDAGRVDEAAAAGRAVCAVMPALTSARVRALLDRLGDALSDHRDMPEAAGFLAELAAVRGGHDHHTPTGAPWPV